MLIIQLFIYLQILDFVTTLVGFRVGAGEASPFIAKLVHLSSPVAGVAASKVFALALGAVCLCTGRQRLLGWMNYWFASLVVWNLGVILVAIG